MMTKRGYAATSKRNVRRTAKRGVSGWFIFFLIADLLVFGGFGLMYSESKGWENALEQAQEVQAIGPDTSGIVAVTGPMQSVLPARDEHLADDYALLVKQEREWSCNSRKCAYTIRYISTVGSTEGLTINGIPLMSSVYRLTDQPIILGEEVLSQSGQTVEDRQVLILEPKGKALSYEGIAWGQQVTVVGEAKEGKLVPMQFPNGSDAVTFAGMTPHHPSEEVEMPKAGYVVGDSLEAVRGHEAGMQHSLAWAALFAAVLFVPATLFTAPWPDRSRRRRG
ncbi:hypothetical protein [Paenibacillus apiarius]|uniref:hypothetical protein n=1 Tax=Paenibacillus apiarius TaxID=46240 RepID=UPI001F09AFA0|nr:hypothetical protein [Paenibacillus apiarius]